MYQLSRFLLLIAIAAMAFLGFAPMSLAEDAVCSMQNPTVMPGLVHWHKSFDDACAAAKDSGKPVLLFQMLGNLDQEFC